MARIECPRMRASEQDYCSRQCAESLGWNWQPGHCECGQGKRGTAHIMERNPATSPSRYIYEDSTKLHPAASIEGAFRKLTGVLGD